MSVEVRLDRLLGREVLTGNNRRLGRIEEFRAEAHDGTCEIHAFVIGVAGLYERLGLGMKRLLFGPAHDGYLVRWDQIDLSDPDRPRLTCSVEELSRL